MLGLRRDDVNLVVGTVTVRRNRVELLEGGRASFTGAFAPWLAHLTDRVDAVVSGGFPIVGDYSPQYADVQARTEAARADPAARSEVTSRFDNRAALGFYRELSALPPNFLVDSLPCPLFAFWGEDDEEIAFGGGVQLLASGLDRRRLNHASFAGHDQRELWCADCSKRTALIGPAATSPSALSFSRSR